MQCKFHGSETAVVNLTNATNYSVVSITVRTQRAITCSKLTIKTPEQGVKYVQS